MGKIIRLTESELVGLVKRVINEQKTTKNPGDINSYPECLKMDGEFKVGTSPSGKEKFLKKEYGEYKGLQFYNNGRVWNGKNMTNYHCLGDELIVETVFDANTTPIEIEMSMSPHERENFHEIGYKGSDVIRSVREALKKPVSVNAWEDCEGDFFINSVRYNQKEIDLTSPIKSIGLTYNCPKISLYGETMDGLSIRMILYKDKKFGLRVTAEIRGIEYTSGGGG
jgi:hypothetical protein